VCSGIPGSFRVRLVFGCTSPVMICKYVCIALAPTGIVGTIMQRLILSSWTSRMPMKHWSGLLSDALVNSHHVTHHLVECVLQFRFLGILRTLLEQKVAVPREQLRRLARHVCRLRHCVIVDELAARLNNIIQVRSPATTANTHLTCNRRSTNIYKAQQTFR